MAGKQSWTVLGGLSAAGGGMVAKKLLHSSWKAILKKEPPANPEHPRTTWPEAIGYALLSGAIMGVGRMVARKIMASMWERRTGALPPGLEEVE